MVKRLLLLSLVLTGCGEGLVRGADDVDQSEDDSRRRNCAALAAPDAQASCHCASGHTCAANGCYDGKYCDTSTSRCVALPSYCGADAGAGGTSGGTTGHSWTGSVGAQGGQVSRLFFAAVGDSRPPNEDETANYPTSVITRIYQGMAASDAQFVVATGDYMFANPSSSNGQAQLDLYLQARAAFPGTVFAAMGNHECNGYTATNCTSATHSQNYQAFMHGLVEPLGQSKPYYRFDVNDTAGQWTAKFVVLAMNAWDSAQGAWLQQQLAQPTTYTFIVRHEPEAATTAPGVTPSDSIISQYPYTLKIVGHTHEFHRASTREVIVGNGGAPLTGNSDYGYALIEQTPSGDLQVSEINFSTNAPVTSFVVPK